MEEVEHRAKLFWQRSQRCFILHWHKWEQVICLWLKHYWVQLFFLELRKYKIVLFYLFDEVFLKGKQNVFIYIYRFSSLPLLLPNSLDQYGSPVCFHSRLVASYFFIIMIWSQRERKEKAPFFLGDEPTLLCLCVGLEEMKKPDQTLNHLSIDISSEVQKRRSADFQALKWWNPRSGSSVEWGEKRRHRVSKEKKKRENPEL